MKSFSLQLFARSTCLSADRNRLLPLRVFWLCGASCALIKLSRRAAVTLLYTFCLVAPLGVFAARHCHVMVALWGVYCVRYAMFHVCVCARDV